jgi:hypothetical protein
VRCAVCLVGHVRPSQGVYGSGPEPCNSNSRNSPLCSVVDMFFAAACADFAFYGNKLFQSTFIALLYPNVSLGTHVCSAGHVA